MAKGLIGESLRTGGCQRVGLSDDCTTERLLLDLRWHGSGTAAADGVGRLDIMRQSGIAAGVDLLVRVAGRGHTALGRGGWLSRVVPPR